MSRTGSYLLRGGAFRLLSMVLSLGVQLITLPYILRHLGDHLYGIWSVVGAATGYYGMLDLGVGSAVTRFVARESGRNGTEAAARYIAAGRRVFRRSALALALLSALIGTVGYFVIEIRTDGVLFFWTVLITGWGLAAAFPSKVDAGVLAANLRHDSLALITLGASLIRAVVSILVLRAGAQILGLAFVNACVSLAQAWAIQWACRRHCPQLPHQEGKGKEATKELFSYAGYSMVSKVADFFRFKVHPLTISAFLKFSDVTPYAIHDRLQGIATDACDSVLSMLSTVFSRQEGRGDQAAMARTYFLSYRISCYVGTWVLGCLVIFSPSFVTLWLGPGHALVITLLWLRAPGSLCGIIQMPSVSLLVGAFQNKRYAWTNAAHALTTLIATVALIQNFGLKGVVIAVAATTAIIKTFIQAQSACDVLGVSLADLHLRHTLPNLARVGTFLLPLAYLATNYPPDSWLKLSLWASGAAMLFAVFLLSIAFPSDERTLLLKAAKRALGLRS
jgi:O-antigen/teichoic acid export membrane protein